MTLIEIKNRISALCAAGTQYGLCRSEEIELQILVDMETKKLEEAKNG